MKSLFSFAISLTAHFTLVAVVWQWSHLLPILKKAESKKAVHSLEIRNELKNAKSEKKKNIKKPAQHLQKLKASGRAIPVPKKKASASPSPDENLKKTLSHKTQLPQQKPGNPAPLYPTLDRLQRKTGTVTLIGFVDDDGRVSKIRVDKSTGTQRMNKSASQAFAKFRFQKGQKGWVKIPFQFSLKGQAQVLSVRSRLQREDSQSL